MTEPRVRAAEAIEAALRAELPGAEIALDRSWSALGLDSFGLVAVRAAAEQAMGREIGDGDWLAAATPADLLSLADSAGDGPPTEPGDAARIEEMVEIGMPQMAQGGLSESWLMRTLGDLHWRLIAAALGTRPADIRDTDGRRLVPVFTRIRFVSTSPFAAYREGERLGFSGNLSRLGADLFFSRIEAEGERGRRIEADLMSSFVARGQESNLDLARGQARIGQGCRAALLQEMPPFGIGYQEERRAGRNGLPVLARMPYEIIPQYDINGVGMLYCAAYPIIADISQMRASGGPTKARSSSTVERDIFYFANADADCDLEWRLHSDPAGDGLETGASIVRGDGVTIAAIRTRKAAS